MKNKICAKAGCGRIVPAGSKYCERHKKLEKKRIIFTKRASSSPYHWMYESYEWRKQSKEFIAEYPYCFICNQPAVLVDHITPHKGDVALFWDRNNWQPMCQSCHSRKTFRENGNFRRSREGNNAP